MVWSPTSARTFISTRLVSPPEKNGVTTPIMPSAMMSRKAASRYFFSASRFPLKSLNMGSPAAQARPSHYRVDGREEQLVGRSCCGERVSRAQAHCGDKLLDPDRGLVKNRATGPQH